MSLVFGGKLLSTSNVVDTSELEKLSKNEKLLLVELERTRNSITQELQVLRHCKGGDTAALDDAIEAYTRQKRSDLYRKKNDPDRFYDTTRRNMGKPSSRALLSRTASSSLGASKLNHVKTALDSIPVLLSMRPSGDPEGGYRTSNKTLPFRMPVFSLPPITLNVTKGSITAEGGSFSKSESSLAYKDGGSTVGNLSFSDHAPGPAPKKGEMSAEEELASQLFLLFNNQNIKDVNMLLGLGIDSMRKASGPRPSIQAMSSFSSVLSDIRPVLSTRSVSSDFLVASKRSSDHAFLNKTVGHVPHSQKGQAPRQVAFVDSNSVGPDSMIASTSLSLGADLLLTSPSSGRALSRSVSSKRGGGPPKKLAPVTVDGMPGKDSSAAELRKELLSSLSNMQKYTVMVKEDILGVSTVVDVRNPKAKAMMLSVAAERMRNILGVIVAREKQRGFRAWQLSVAQLRTLEKLKIFLRFRNVRAFAARLVKAAVRIFKKQFRHWREVAAEESLRLRRERERAAAVEVQRVFRGFLGRRRKDGITAARKYAKMYHATVKIQALFRCKGTRWKYLRYLRNKNEFASTILIQRVARGFLGRKRFRRIRVQQNRSIAVTMIQAIVRGRRGRNIAKKRAHLRACIRAAVLIQAQIRGYLTRRRVDRILEEKLRDWGLRFIQRVFRGVICRMNMARKRREIEEYRRNRALAATRVQASYRGFRGRILARAHIVQKRRKNAKLSNAAAKIGKIVRGFNARAELRNLKKERLQKWVANASVWKETWSDDARAWFYVNEQTGDASWEPHPEGYTRADGQLVLANGQTVDYYNVLNGGEVVDVDKVRLQNCIECSYRTAIRACNECGDCFCTKCYKETHAIGGRRTHTYTAVGPIDCSECEEVLAERWCVACDESYCDECWRKVHNHGKRRAHPFSKISATGSIAAAMFTIDGEQVHEYTNVHSQHHHQRELDMASIASAENSTVAWDTSGYYNDQGSMATAEPGAEWGYYDANGQYVYNDQSYYDYSEQAQEHG